jgi:hypothetical protein
LTAVVLLKCLRLKEISSAKRRNFYSKILFVVNRYYSGSIILLLPITDDDFIPKIAGVQGEF